MTDEEWMQQVVALREQIARETREAQAGAVREQTAATILAALIARGHGSPEWYATEAVRLTDALRAELKGGGA